MQTTKIPATIVTGFLGSGKTTLMRHILEQAKGLRVAVIVNEFGELGIDGEILKTCAIGCAEEGGADGQIYELANGCMCCTVQEEFFPVMKALAERRADIDVLLIETSGLALPKPLVQAFQWPDQYPQNNLSYAGNFLRMMFGNPCEEYQVNPVIERAMDRIFILHADHEQNASTSTVRLCGSSGTNPFAAIAAGVACLWGPAHGGANEACLNMLEDIQRMGGVAKVGEFMEKVKDKSSGVKLMGFGHRVYKNYDPRAKLMQETCNEVLAALGLEKDPLFALAKQLEKIALEDEYFVSRKLYPNVDFYSGIVQRAIGIPVNLFTGIFALARTVGWIAQLNEMISDPEYKIGRPRQLYTGSPRRDIKR